MSRKPELVPLPCGKFAIRRKPNWFMRIFGEFQFLQTDYYADGGDKWLSSLEDCCKHSEKEAHRMFANF